ncbi:thiol-disulfide isomerase/thioredoxin [Paenibacillus phyllosphaerae]|uniref:Thiol-disulfide isomerase/thioredoxin n=1 Tax=Paenibacillus phyllosphaerae TaxID=274593 RepID=A0A7W5AW85_9BACL|nr:TlpA disulfide reductase family protein [Paenibacillus phyllosphaerae]MBB3109969.1 thiol-disulfide isomerase/thioredoxin [Paenibacillus phyllosphaerae]
MKRSLILLAVVVVMIGVAVYQNIEKSKPLASATTALEESSSANAASVEVKPKPGYTAPVLTLPDLADQNMVVGGQNDKLVLVNFWASWCGPCELEAPDLQALSEEYKDGMVLLGVNATSYDKERQAREFVDQQKFTFPILMDREGAATEQYKITSFPTSLIIDQNGIVRERVTGVITKAAWKEKIDKWLPTSNGSSS